MTNNPKGKTNTDGHEATLIQTDSPDDFSYEGKSKSATSRASSAKSNGLNSSAKAGNKHLGDNAYVTVDNPDDFE